VPLVDFRIVDAEMKEVAHDGRTAGEIVVRAPWLTMGYLNNPASSEKLWEGWLPSHRRHRHHDRARCRPRLPNGSRT